MELCEPGNDTWSSRPVAQRRGAVALVGQAGGGSGPTHRGDAAQGEHDDGDDGEAKGHQPAVAGDMVLAFGLGRIGSEAE